MTALDMERAFELTAKGEINGDSVTVTVDRHQVTVQWHDAEIAYMDHAVFDFAAAELGRYRRLAGLIEGDPIDHEEGAPSRGGKE